MRKYISYVTIAAMILVGGTIGAKDIAFNGMLRSYTGVSVMDANLTKNEQTLDLTLEGWGDMTRLVVNPYAYVGIESEPELGIREAYIDFFFDDADIRVGKQAIMWGQAEGAFITDIVSPRDMRSFILADFREIRKGIPAVKADYYAGSYTFEGIWIPQFVPSSMPASDSIWTREMPLPFPAGTSVTVNDPDSPALNLENSEIFGKIRYFGPRISWEVMGGYAWTDEPYIESMTLPPAVTDPEANQAYGRYTVVGGSFSTTLGNAVLRGEAAAYLDKPFSVVSGAFPAVSVSVEERHQLQALAGLDWSLWGMEMSGQYILSYIHNYTDGMIEQGKMLNEMGHTVTFRVQDTYMDDRLTAKIFTYVELDPMNALIRPSLSWSLEDGVLLEGGLEIFVGDEDGTFGAYEDNSMGYVSLRWYF
ncbi:DUF1302 family protein [Pleomorphochaeta sp. DL1XJH-081]|uniref:DUF1302 family protein n=1 Tax=Pleomorphochaeta sp. DL1XJH-081 TaxID=3409690 RepID=UPI003BB69BCB